MANKSDFLFHYDATFYSLFNYRISNQILPKQTPNTKESRTKFVMKQKDKPKIKKIHFEPNKTYV